MVDKFYRHGDVSIYRIDAAPVDGKAIQHNGSYVLAEGESTGHMHTLTVDDEGALQVLETANGIILQLEQDGTITHQEHGTIVLPAGTYRVGKEREYDWFAMAPRQVVD